MPLQHSSSDAAFKSNLKAELAAGKPRDQALAISYSVKRKAKANGGSVGTNIPWMDQVSYPPSAAQAARDVATERTRRSVVKRAAGGMAPAPWYTRSEARGMTGPLHSKVPGRTDHIPLNVPAGAYVLPADHVSHMGQGNSQAGLSILHNMFSSGPYGSSLPKIGGRSSLPKAPRRADGGSAEGEGAVPIMAAGGEYVIDPSVVATIGGGDMDKGHKILDHWVVETRKKHVKTLRKLPGPSR